jgi:hypothetical protein
MEGSVSGVDSREPRKGWNNRKERSLSYLSNRQGHPANNKLTVQEYNFVSKIFLGQGIFKKKSHSESCTPRNTQGIIFCVQPAGHSEADVAIAQVGLGTAGTGSRP